MTPPPHRPDLRGIGESAFIEVLGTLLRLSPTVEDPATSTAITNPGDRITSSVLLTGPRLYGNVHIHLPKGFASLAAFLLTGFDDAAAEADGLLDDTAGELANMVAGRVAARLAEHGYACTLGPPSVSRSAHPSIENQTAVEHGRANLTCEDHRLAIEIRCRYTTHDPQDSEHR